MVVPGLIGVDTEERGEGGGEDGGEGVVVLMEVLGSASSLTIMPRELRSGLWGEGIGDCICTSPKASS